MGWDGIVTQEILQRAGLGCSICHDVLEVAQGIDAGAGALIMTDAALAAPGIQTVLTCLARQPAWPVLPLCQI